MKKIGRNEKCPYGSGKKYKYCCLDKVIDKGTYGYEEYITNEHEFDGFPNMRDKSKRLKKIISKYNFTDLVKAIFTINIIKYSRSALENSLALNH